MSQIDLLKLNVNDHVEKKNGLSYVSWAWAWAEALKADPSCNFEVHTFDGLPYMRVNDTGMVWVTVKMFDKSMTCFLPVMNHRNQPIANPDSFQVNTAIMRCLTKGLAMHGLGLYIYAGEDLPEADDSTTAEAPPAAPTVESTTQADANANLFTKAMLDYILICESVKDLNSYWKANQVQLDGLKVSHPALYERIRNGFSDLKKQFSEKEASK